MNAAISTLHAGTRFNSFYLFSGICALAIALSFTVSRFLISDDLYYQSFGEQLDYDRIVELVNIGKKWQWLGYAIMPVVYFIKFFFAAGSILIGCLVAGHNLSFRKLFNVVVIAEFVFLLSTIIKVVWFGFINETYTLQELQNFAPLSLLSLFESSLVDPWLLYPLQLINVFEVVYCILLAAGLSLLLKQPLSKTTVIIFASYGLGIMVWAIFVVFLSMNFAS